jgi:hypothetical protein
MNDLDTGAVTQTLFPFSAEHGMCVTSMMRVMHTYGVKPIRSLPCQLKR